jgi:phage FluMu protein Com
MKCCPHCKGVAGFEFEQTEKLSYAGDWETKPVYDGNACQYENTDVVVMFRPKTVKCMDCGKRVPRKDAIHE